MNHDFGQPKPKDSTFLLAKELETIKDDASSKFQSDREFDDSDHSKKHKSSIKKEDASVSSHSSMEESKGEKEKPFFFAKNDTLNREEKYEYVVMMI